MDQQSSPRPLLGSHAAFPRPIGMRHSTQLHQAVADFDEILSPKEPDYAATRLKAASVIRLGYLAVLPQANFIGKLGTVSQARVTRLRMRLAEFLRQ